MFTQKNYTTIIRTHWTGKYESRRENEFWATCHNISNLFDGCWHPLLIVSVLIGCLYCFGLTTLFEKAFYRRHTTTHLMGSSCNEIQKQFLRCKKKIIRETKSLCLKKQNKTKQKATKEKQKLYLIHATHSSLSRLLELRINYSCLTPNQYCVVEGSEFVFIAPEWYRPKLFSLLTAPSDPSKSHSFSLLLFTNQAPLRSILV